MSQLLSDSLELAKLAFDEGRKGLADQDQTISSIRQRAIWIGGLSGVIASFLGREALEQAPLIQLTCSVESFAILLGFVALCVVYVAVFNSVRPRKNLVFHNKPSSLIEQFIEGENATDLTTSYKALAAFAEENYERNNRVIKFLFQWLMVAAISMFVEFFSWIIVLA